MNQPWNGPPLQTERKRGRQPKETPVMPTYGIEDLDRLTIYWVIHYISAWCHSPEPTGVLRDLGRMLIQKIRNELKIPEAEGDTERWVLEEYEGRQDE